MGISSAGIGSGLNVESIVTSLMNVERQPLTLVANQKTAYQSKISAYGTLSSSLSTFQTALANLSSAANFNVQSATSSDTSVFSATADGTATIGSYAVNVSQLASSQKIASAGFLNSTDVVGTGTLTIAFGTYNSGANTFTANASKTAVNITIDATNNTLAGVRDAINASGASVTATIVNNGTTNQLVVTSKDTGAVNSLKITTADADGNNLDNLGLSQLAYDPTATAGAGKNLTQLQAANNALLTIDGIAVTKASNTITDAISGVTLNLLKTSAVGVNASLGVASDQAKVTASVQAFVDGYNKLNTTLRSLTKYDPTGVASGPLLGDSTARSVSNQIRSVMTNAINTSTGGTITTLSQIGVSFQNDGSLALNTTKLTSVMSTNFSDIAALFASTGKASDSQISFAGSSTSTKSGVYAVTVTQLGTALVNAAGTINGVAVTGIGTHLVGATGDASQGLNINVLGGALGSRGTVSYSVGYAAQLNNIITTNLTGTSGIITARTDGINASITNLDKQTASLNIRMAAIEARYRAQYTQLDTLMASMSTTSTFLTQQLASINANSK